MASAQSIEQLEQIFSSFLESKGFELVELLHQYSGPRLMLTVLTDRKGSAGISLGDCAWLCKELKTLLEEKNIIDSDYMLEVASPGLDRPLKNAKDFARSIGKETVLFLKEPVEGRIQWQGAVSRMEEGSVFIQTKEKVIGIELSKINKAKLVI